MNTKQTLQSCIKQCQTAAGDIKSMAQGASGPAKQSLDQAAQSIDACIKQCQNAINQI